MNTMDTATCYRILIIDDNPAIHGDIRKILCGRSEAEQAFADAKSRIFGQQATLQRPVAFAIDSAHQGKEGLRMVQEATQSGQPVRTGLRGCAHAAGLGRH